MTIEADGAGEAPPRQHQGFGVADASDDRGFAAGGPSWTALGLIAAGHVAVLAVLLTTGAIRIGASPPPVAVAFVEEVIEPAPAAAPAEIIEPVTTEIFVPEIIIATPAAPPPTVTVTESPPAPPAAVARTMSPGAELPVVPPDFSADQLNNPGPRYPSASRRSHEEGTVMLKVLVSPDGRAQQLAVANSSGFARLDDAALATVKRWAFVPARQAGRAVAAWVLVPVTFELGEDGRRRGRDRRRDDRHAPDGGPTAEPLPATTST